MALQSFCQALPKIELHAHLNGSLTEATLRELGSEAIFPKHTTLDECFKLFKIAHDATTTTDAVYIATKSVINDFHQENVIYLELRTTPRASPTMTKPEYIQAVIDAINDNDDDITVKLLLSIDRSHDLSESFEALDLILAFRGKYPDVVKGIELSGDPKKGIFSVPLFKKAKLHGLSVSLHCAEVEKHGDPREIERMMEFMPDRIGHATHLHPNYGGDPKNWNLYVNQKIPIEMCLTSNVVCGTSKNYKEHHIGEWIKNSLPFSIATDDKGVFNTTLSNEYYLVAENFDLDEKDLYDITFKAVQHSFASKEEQVFLRYKLKEWKKLNF